MAIKKIIIDTDPGIDDAMAIFLALRSPEIEVVGLTTIFGNVNCQLATVNALRLLETAGHSRIPVAKGCDSPLFISAPEHATRVHGEDGMGNANFALPKGSAIEMSAAEFIVKTILAHPGEITLVPIGPLTNIALALKLEPKIINLVKEVVIMGGAATVAGNITPVAEANIWQDPHAAAIVFNAGLPLTMIGLDVTSTVLLTEDYLVDLYSANNPETELLRKIIPHYQQFYLKMYGSKDFHTHDPSTIAYLINPNLFTTQLIPIFVETDGRCIGQTIPDFRHQWGQQCLTKVCLGVEGAGVLKLIKSRLMA